MKYKIL